MNRNVFLGVLVLASAATTSSAFADTGLAGDISVETRPFVSTRTRAEVEAELAQYQRAGVNPWATAYNPLKSFRSEKTRAQVEQEYVASRAEVRAMTGEDSGSSYLAAHRAPAVGPQLAGQPVRAQ
jgi:hypothetical protein